MADKKVTLEVAVETQANKIDALESRLNQLKSEKIEADIDVNSARLDEVNSQIQSVEGELEKLESGADIPVEVEDSEIQKLKAELDSLKDEKTNLEIKVASDELKKAKFEAQSLNKTPVEIPLTTKGVEKLDKIKQTVNGLKTKTVNIPIATTGESKLDSVQGKVLNLDGRQIVIPIDTDGEEKINAVYELIGQANGKTIVVPVTAEGEEVLDAIGEKIGSLNGKSITVPVNTEGGASLDSISNKLMGLAGTIGMVDQATQMWEASTARQSQQFYLSANLGVSEAQRMQKEIQNIVSQVPGDDTFMNQLMTTALAQNTKMTTDELRNMANVAADYMAGSKMMGKMNLESQQDIYKYLLDGNTAELERGSILSSQVDKLKDQATIQDRIKAINEALQAMGYAGISGYDTAANNLEEFNGRLDKARADWGDVFLPLEQGALKAALALDDQYGGALAMAITGTQTLIPTVISGVSAFGEFHRGVEALKDSKIGDWAGSAKGKFNNLRDSIRNVSVGEKFSSIKKGLIDIGVKAKEAAVSIGSTLKKALVGAATAAKEAVVWLARTSKELLISAANAIKSAAAWVWDNAVKAASTIATKAMAAAQWLLNAAMSANPITLVVIAIVALVAILWYLYNTCEPVRNAIDGIWAGVSGAIQPIIESVQWLIDKLTQLANGDWTVTIEIAKAGASAGIEGIFNFANNDISRGIVSAIVGDEAMAELDANMPAFQEKLTTSFNEMLDAIWNDGTQGFLGWLWNLAGIDVGGYLTGLQSSFMSIPEWVNQAATGAIQGFQGMLMGVSAQLNSIITTVIGFGGRLVQGITTAARNAWTSFVNNIKGMWHHMQEEVDAILGEAERLLRELPSKLWNAAVRMVEGWLTGSAEHSPGAMYDAFHGELVAMESRASTNNIAELMGGTAKNMVSQWGNPTLDYSVELDSVTSNGSFDMAEIIRLLNDLIGAVRSSNGGNIDNTFVLNGDVDNEDRMQKFLDAVIREMEWDNARAGRTID